MKGLDYTTQTTVQWAIDVGNGFAAIVDAEDYEMLSGYKWHLHTKHGINYARHTFYKDGKYGAFLMHRLIMKPPQHKIIDHINGDGLDNRKINLRICTHAENLLNRSPRKGTSKFRGIHWHERDKRWIASATKQGKRKIIGYFHSEEEAARAYDEVASILFGEFARLNFPQEKVV